MKFSTFIFFVLFLAGCEPDIYQYDIIVTETANNMGDLNSAYDDWNSDLPFPYERSEIWFSSNRNSYGGEFDLVACKLDFSYHEDHNILDLSTGNEEYVAPASALLPVINSPHDELGPHSFLTGEDMLFLYATNPGEVFEIRFVELTRWNYGSGQTVSDPVAVAGLNESGDNLYPCIDEENRKIYFCSNRDGLTYDIYSAQYNSPISKQSLIGGDIAHITKEMVSSGYDDKCPYIYGDFIVFASNREGSYDLWYSKKYHDEWMEPIKLQPTINSEYNEYRPVLFQVLGVDLMVFSSDRAGGKGGYDLYIVKIGNYLN
ncbi:MAG TPA: hypothetical protein PKW78_07840 [Bacteroidales bacterium]|nr:hypothetical protein [Bacteroidales bacterium]